MVAAEPNETVEMPADPCSVQCIATLLSQHGAMSLEEIARALSVPPETVTHKLDELVQQRKIEVLRPIGGMRCNAEIPHMTNPELEYCRWIRTTDTDHVWQTRMSRSSSLMSTALECKMPLMV